MGTFNTKQTLAAQPDLIPAMADRICSTFQADGFDVKREELISGGVDISIAKGGTFKAVLGLKSALKVSLIPAADGVAFDAGVGIFGQQAIPTVISYFFLWPVLVTQIWGMVQQSKLDDRALACAQAVINESNARPYASNAFNGNAFAANAFPGNTAAAPAASFCTQCGSPVPPGSRFCPACGNKLV